MAFKVLDASKRKPQMHSLIDMSFILLLFFLVTSMIVQMKEKEQKLSIPTPKNEPGRAQILVQLIDQNQFLFLDENSSKIVEDVKMSFGWQPFEWQKQEIIRRFLSSYSSSKTELLNKLTALKNVARENPEANYFVLIRCPDHLPYYHVVDIIQALSGISNIQYGCVGGSLADIQKAKKIDMVIETDQSGQRSENLVILF